MSNTATSTASHGTPVSSLLLVAFIVLKLTHVINWSWWWVLSPLWIPFGIFGVVLLIIGIIAVIAAFLK